MNSLLENLKNDMTDLCKITFFCENLILSVEKKLLQLYIFGGIAHLSIYNACAKRNKPLLFWPCARILGFCWSIKRLGLLAE